MPRKTYMNWSSGKDSSMALYAMQQDPSLRIDRLLTTVNKTHERVSMHGLRTSLLQAQAQAIGLPLDIIELSETADMPEYNHLMKTKLDELSAVGYSDTIFGDIFLEDLRRYRQDMLAPYGFQVHFPLWQKDTRQLLNEFIAQGFAAIVVCINANSLDKRFVGRRIDAAFIDELPADVDPCGENGEFHTFCYDGPIFAHRVEFEIGEKVYRTYSAPKTDTNPNAEDYGFWFCDLLPC